MTHMNRGAFLGTAAATASLAACPFAASLPGLIPSAMAN